MDRLVRELVEDSMLTIVVLIFSSVEDGRGVCLLVFKGLVDCLAEIWMADYPGKLLPENKILN